MRPTISTAGEEAREVKQHLDTEFGGGHCPIMGTGCDVLVPPEDVWFEIAEPLNMCRSEGILPAGIYMITEVDGSMTAHHLDMVCSDGHAEYSVPAGNRGSHMMDWRVAKKCDPPAE